MSVYHVGPFARTPTYNETNKHAYSLSLFYFPR